LRLVVAELEHDLEHDDPDRDHLDHRDHGRKAEEAQASRQAPPRPQTDDNGLDDHDLGPGAGTGDDDLVGTPATPADIHEHDDAAPDDDLYERWRDSTGRRRRR
jgi:hypothetical protein